MLDRIKKAKNIHIVGISGTEGAAVALFLAKLDVNFIAHDFASSGKFRRSFLNNHFGISATEKQRMFDDIKKLEDRILLQKNYLTGIENADLIFVSQNWQAYPPNRKLQRIFTKNPKKFTTITQLYFDFFPGKIVAITGTNGKSTTSRLIAEILEKSRQKSWFTGNDRRNVQILNSFTKWKKSDSLVLEVSNRQLKFDFGKAPDIAVVTNVTENHLDEYEGSFSKYKAGKFRLLRRQSPTQVAVLNADNPATKEFAQKTKSNVLSYSLNKKVVQGVYLDNGWIMYRNKKNTHVLPIAKIKLIGRHNLSNILAAIAAARTAGASWNVIREVVINFRGLAQRLELIATKNGVKFINDTSSTTPESTIAALTSFPRSSVHLIAGGDSKGMNYSALAQEIQCSNARVTLVESPVADLIGKKLKTLKINFKIVETLQAAVKNATKNAQRGESVLLSPAAAWFCYFNGKIPLSGRGFEQFVKALA